MQPPGQIHIIVEIVGLGRLHWKQEEGECDICKGGLRHYTAQPPKPNTNCIITEQFPGYAIIYHFGLQWVYRTAYYLFGIWYFVHPES